MKITAQKVFNETVRHLHKQGKRAVGLDPRNGIMYCQYRAPGGLRCAVGYWIPDDKYNPWWDEISYTSIEDVVHGAKLKHLEPHVELLADLQSAHDAALVNVKSQKFTSPWSDESGIARNLAEVAKEHKLSPAAVSRCWSKK
jgi:hypothetical protein